jgi:hypothetical protein
VAWRPTVARLRAFRGIDTLIALTIHVELGADWQEFARAKCVGSWHQLMRKPANVINVAVDRELSCFLWAAATAP